MKKISIVLFFGFLLAQNSLNCMNKKSNISKQKFEEALNGLLELQKKAGELKLPVIKKSTSQTKKSRFQSVLDFK